MKKLLLSSIILLVVSVTNVWAQPGVFNHNDPIVSYDPNNPPATPPPNTIAKWVRTKRVSWNSDNFKAYYYNDMAFRVRFPKGYNPADQTKKYPVILFFHGGGEIAPVTDNDYHLFVGAERFEKMVENDQFNAFLVYPQIKVLGWDYNYMVKVNNVMDSLEKYCNTDPDRVISMGLSNGAYGAMFYSITFPQRAATTIAGSPAVITILEKNTANYIHVPFWLASGGTDHNPSPGQIYPFVDTFTNRGGNIRFNLYPQLGHNSWETQWDDPSLLPTFNAAHKANPLIYYNRTKFISAGQITAKLGITNGFFQYQWQKNEVDIPGAVSNEYAPTDFGTYRVRFKRFSYSNWSVWSPIPAVISQDNIAPSVPTGLRSLFTGRSIVNLDWSSSTDNNAVTQYEVFVNGEKRYTTGESAITADNLQPNTSYVFTVRALDQAGNASGISTQATASTITGTNGLNYRYYEGNWTKLPNFNDLTPVSSGISANIDLNKRTPGRNDQFAFVWEGYINIKNAGTYTFETSSDDGSKVYFNSVYVPTGRALVNNDDAHGVVSRSGTVDVPAPGLYPITITYFDQYNEETMDFYWSGPGFGRSKVPDSVFFDGNASVPDNIAPSVPANLKVTNTSSSFIDLDWDNSTDNVAVTSYDIYVDNVKKYSSSSSNISANGLSPNTTYNFKVKALDQAGNVSAFSTTVSATTTGGTVVTGGLNYKYYEGSWNTLPDFNTLAPVKTGSSANIDLGVRTAGRNDNYAFVWEGNINITTPGNYTFETVSDDGSKFYFNTLYSPNAVALVNNDGLHAPQAVAGNVNIPAAGLYPVSITFFEKDGGETMQLYWTGPGITRQLVPSSAFTTDGTPPPPPPPPVTSGLQYRYYEGDWDVLPNFNNLTPIKSGNTPNIDLSPRNRNDFFGFVWEGHIKIPVAGTYTFETISDDGSKVYFNTFYSPQATPVVNNDGLHGPGSVSGTVFVPAAGVYPITMTFFEKGSGETMQVYWSGPGIPRQLIPNAAFNNSSGSGDNGIPTTPGNLRALYSNKTYVNLDWDNSTDNLGVTGYEIYVNNQKKYTTTESAITADKLTPNTSYTFTVRAIDASGNASPLSNVVTASTTATVPGPNFRYYQGSWNTLPNFNTLTPLNYGLTPNTDINARPAGVNDNFAFVWEGYLNFANPGDYIFELISDDGSRLYFNSFYAPAATPVINNDGLHAATSQQGSVNVPAPGLYPISLVYFEKDGGETMQLYISGPNVPRQLIPAGALMDNNTGTTVRNNAVSINLTNSATADIEENSAATAIMKSLKAYPNPMAEWLNVDIYVASQKNDIGVDVIDMNGKVVFKNNFKGLPSGNNTLKMNMGNGKLSPGVYFVKVNVNGIPSSVIKMVKSRN